MLFGTLVPVRSLDRASSSPAAAATAQPKLSPTRPAVASHRWLEAVQRPRPAH